MKWADFAPYVMPYVLGCPMPTLEAHVRDAAIEFLRETSAWVRTLDPELSGPTNEVDLSPTSNLAHIIDVHGVLVEGVPASFSVAPDFSYVTVDPQPDPGVEVVVKVAQALKPDATEMPDEFKPYARHIAHGAIASIKRIPGQDFSGPDAEHEMRFRQHIRTESARLARGLVVSGQGRAPVSFM